MIRMIVAYDRKQGMAKDGIQPWYIPDDMQYFTDKTKQYGGCVLVGSTTFKMFKGPLENRQTFVLTRQQEFIEGVQVVHDLAQFLNDLPLEQDVWIGGGAQLYKLILDRKAANQIYATEIDADFGCTLQFPSFKDAFIESSMSNLHEQNGFIYRFRIFDYKENR
jgi:dihydrofolate reductase